MHVEFLLEEPSAEAALKLLVPKIRDDADYSFHVFNGKPDLFKQLPARLRAYRRWIPADYRLVVVVDEDRKDCRELKDRLERMAIESGFFTKTSAKGGNFQVLNRIAIEELEAWYFGEPQAVVTAFPRVKTTVFGKAAYRDPDAIGGGTAEALERILRQARYYPAGMPKIEVAEKIAAAMTPAQNQSKSFQVFREGLLALS
jgi:hypothetical protein